MVLNLNIFADSVEIAEELYSKRGEDVENARKAAEIYKNLATTEEDKEAKAELLIRHLGSLYYVGNQLTVKKEKLKFFRRGATLAETIVELVTESETPDEELLSWALYWRGVYLSKFGQTKGVLKSLGLAPDVKGAMKRIIEMGYEDINYYGTHRILGRIFYKIPGFLGGSKKKANVYLEKAFTETLAEGTGISVHGLNNVYYADALVAVGEKEKACEILKVFVEQDPTTFLEDRIPETAQEIVVAREAQKGHGCL